MGVEPGDSKAFARLLTNKIWLLGLVAQILGVVLQAAALDRGRVAIIQPLLVATIIWAMPLGYFLTQQKIDRPSHRGRRPRRRRAWRSSPASATRPAASTTRRRRPGCTAIIVVVAACAGCPGRAPGGPRRGRPRLGATAGILYGVSADADEAGGRGVPRRGLGRARRPGSSGSWPSAAPSASTCSRSRSRPVAWCRRSRRFRSRTRRQRRCSGRSFSRSGSTAAGLARRRRGRRARHGAARRRASSRRPPRKARPRSR